MTEDTLPTWMKRRDPPPQPDNHQRDIVKTVSAMGSVAVFVTVIALGMYAAIERATWFHLTVIAAGAILLTMVFVYRVEGNRRTGVALVLFAVVVNCALYHYACAVAENLSGTLALAFGLLYTGLCALLLLSRSDVKPTRLAKLGLMTSVLALSSAGPLMRMSGLTSGTVGGFTGFLLVLSFPMIPLSLATFLVLSARHRSEITLPSDKWV